MHSSTCDAYRENRIEVRFVVESDDNAVHDGGRVGKDVKKEGNDEGSGIAGA